MAPSSAPAQIGCFAHSKAQDKCGEDEGRGGYVGDDVLLRHGPNAWFVGDAAGLITDLGGCIHYAIESAALLADSLASGVPYEDAMAPTVADVTGGARSIEASYYALGG